METEEKPSKTRRKLAMHGLQALGERLVRLNSGQLEAIALPESLREAIEAARRITRHEARRRQLQYIGRLMRSIDPEPIREKLKTWDGISEEGTARLHRIERWRDRLIEGDGALGELAGAHPGIDTQRLRALARNAREERAASRPPRAYRELFQVLRELIPPPEASPDHGDE
ncbi:MAG: ribosome biogenesis factor YjgA [Burkholderiales bacterium]